jgi:Transposase DDE domain
MLHALADKQWMPLVKPWPLRPAVAGGCPGEVTRTVSAQGRATFKAACPGCRLRQRCTASATGQLVLLGEHHQLQREHSQRAADDGFQSVYRQHRPMVERSIAWLTRGARRVPYRGVEKNNNWLHHRVAAFNLRRLLAMGMTHQDGTWHWPESHVDTPASHRQRPQDAYRPAERPVVAP